MSRTLFVLFNHTLTPEQEADARASLGVTRVVEAPEMVRALWRDVPPEPSGIAPLFAPVRDWLTAESRVNDCVLIQGDFGATYLMVRFAIEIGLVPLYSTTGREATEALQPDGSIQLTHRFRHVRFRAYGE